MDSALDTLCSQAYAAANTLEEKKIVGEILQRGFVILMTICIFIVGLWYIDNY
jgi:MATE family multidrug resistance protein